MRNYNKAEVLAIMLGIVNNTKGVINRKYFNILAEELGREGIDNPSEFSNIIGDIKVNPTLNKLYRDASYGALGKGDILQEESSSVKGEPEDKIVVKKRSSGEYSSERMIELREEELQDENLLLEKHGYDPEKWAVKTSSNTLSSRETQHGEFKSYNSRITVMPRPKPELDVEKIVELLRKRVEPVQVTKYNEGNTHLTIPLFDLHFGITTYEEMLPKLQQLEEIISKGYKSIHIIVGGDFQHSDVMNKAQTSNLTVLDPVDNDQALEDGHRFLSELIEISLHNCDNVQVHSIPGNHDYSKQYVLLWGMQFLYPQVDFNITRKSRLAFGFGTVSFLILHGDVAMKSAPMLFASEYPELWAKSTYRSIYSGHLHSERVLNADGVVMHRFGTPKPSDEYEFKNGYTLARKHLQAQEFNDTRLLATYEVE